MLHASRGSSWTLEPLIERLAGERTVIGIDTPGHGESEPLPIERPPIGDYAGALVETFDALGLGHFDLYGAHTGAKIAIEYVTRNPEKVRRLVLDGLAIYTPEEREEMV